MSLQQQPHQRIFLVTEANKGIGFEVVKKLAANHPTDLILLSSRDQKRGAEAAAQLDSPSNVKVLVLDTSSKESIEQAKHEIQKKYGGHLDVLINNTGIYSRESHSHRLFKAVEEGKDPKTVGFDPIKIPGFDNEAILYYSASKLGVNILTRLEARDWNKKYSAENVIISAVCSGLCATDLNDNIQGGRSAELGADSILHAVYTANLENGHFWKDGNRLPLESS